MLQGWFCPSGPTHNFPLRSPNLISGWRIDPNWKCNQENRSDLLNHFYGITSLGLGRLWSLFSRKDQVQVWSRVIGVRFKVKLQIFYDLLSLKLSVQVMWLKSTPLTHLKTQTLTSGASSLESWLRTKSLKYYFILVTPPKIPHTFTLQLTDMIANSLQASLCKMVPAEVRCDSPIRQSVSAVCVYAREDGRRESFLIHWVRGQLASVISGNSTTEGLSSYAAVRA